MKAEEIFANRRVVADICRSIGENGSHLINTKYSSKVQPALFSIDEIKNNGRTLREHAQAELLEVRSKTREGGQEGFLQEFYNARDILKKDSFAPENQNLETIRVKAQRNLLLFVICK